MWTKILVDWVNCLKLSKSIQKLEDLRDGLFFENLQKVLTKSTESKSDVLTCLFQVLHLHYPHFKIRNESNVHISDLSHEDLLAITSLLVHYTCIHDRRDVLTSPLCHSLQGVTQVGIRSFLEEIQLCSQLTNKELADIIERCTKSNYSNHNTADPSQQWLALANSAEMKQSPLQDILKTPVSNSNRMMQRDKEIAKLRTELELAKEDKEDAEEDLKLQLEKNKKLEQYLSQKKMEIARLRSEVVALENRTPPHYQDIDLRESLKILRTKVESLEQTIEQCDKENEQLLQERDSEKAQVKVLEAQCKMWLERFIETDNNLQILTEHTKEQEMKYEHLRNHCNELEALLEELKPNNEALIDESFQMSSNLKRRSKNLDPTIFSEDLAHSVVDIQLREKEQENEELLKSITGLQEQLGKVSSEKKSIASELKILQKNFDNCILQNECVTKEVELVLKENNDVKLKLAEIITENKQLSNKEISIQQQLNDVLLENETLSFKLEEETLKMLELLHDLEVSSEKVTCLERENQQLSQKLIEDIARYNTESNETCEKLNLVRLEKQNIIEYMQIIQKTFMEILKIEVDTQSNVNIKENKDTNNETIFELEEFSKSFVIISAKLEEITKHNHNLLRDIQELDTKERNISEKLLKVTEEKAIVTNLVDLYQNELQEVMQDKETLTKQKLEINQHLELTKHEIEALKREKLLQSEQMALLNKTVDDMLQMCDKLSEEKVTMSEQLETVSREKAEFLVELNKVCEEKLRITIQQQNFVEEMQRIQKTVMEILKIDINTHIEEDKHAKYQTIFEWKEFSESFNILIIKMEELTKKNTTQSNYILKLETENKDILEKLLKVTEEKSVLMEGNDEILKTLRLSNNEVQQLLQKVEVLLEEKLAADTHLKTMQFDFEKLNTEKLLQSEQIADLDRILEESLHTLDKLSEEKANILEQLEVMTLEKAEVYVQLDRVSQEKLKVTFEQQNIVKEMQNIQKRVINALKINIPIHIEEENHCQNGSEVEWEELFKNFSIINPKIEELSIENNTLSSSIHELETEHKDILEKVVKLAQEKDVLRKENNDMLEKLETSDKEVQRLLEEAKGLLDQKLEADLNFMSMKLKFEARFEESTKEKVVQSERIADLNRRLEESSHKFDKLSEEAANISEELEKVTLEKAELIVQCDKTTAKLEETCNQNKKLSNDIQVLQSEHNELSMTLLTRTEEKAVLSNILDVKNLELQNVVQVLEALEIRYKEIQQVLLQEKEASMQQKLKSDESIESMKLELDLLNSEKSVLSEENFHLNKKLNDHLQRFNKLSKETSNISDQLETLCQEKAECSLEVDKVSQEKIKLAMEKQMVIKEMQTIQNTLLEILKMEMIIQIKDDKTGETISESEELSKNFYAICEKIEDLTKENHKLSSGIQEFETEHSKVLANLSTVTEENYEIRKALEMTNKQVQQMLEEKKSSIEQKLEVGGSFGLIKSKFKVSDTKKCKQITNMNKNLDLFHELKENISKLLDKVTREKAEILEQFEKLSEDKLRLALENQTIIDEIQRNQNSVMEILNIKINVHVKQIDIENEKPTFDFEAFSKNLSIVYANINAITKENKELLAEIQKVKIEKDDISEKLLKVMEENAVISKFLALKKLELQSVVQDQEALMQQKLEVEGNLQLMQLEIEKLSEESSLHLEQIEVANNNLQKSLQQVHKISQEKDIISEQLEVVSVDKAACFDRLEAVTHEKLKLALENQNIIEEMQRIQKILLNILQIEVNIQVPEDKHDKSETNFEWEQFFKNFSIIVAETDRIMKENNKQLNDYQTLDEDKNNVLEQLSKVTEQQAVVANFLDLKSIELKQVLKKNEFLIEQKLEAEINFQELKNKYEVLNSENLRQSEQIVDLKAKLEDTLQQSDKLSQEKQQAETMSRQMAEFHEVCQNKLVLLELEKQQILTKIQEIQKMVRNIFKTDMDIHIKEDQQKNNDAVFELEDICRSCSIIIAKVEEITKENDKLLNDIQKLKTEQRDLLQKFVKVTEEKDVVSNFLELNNNELQKVSQEKDEILEALEMSNKEVNQLHQEKETLSEQKLQADKALESMKHEFEMLNIAKFLQSEQLDDILQQFNRLSKEKANISEQFERVCREKAEFSIQLDKVSQEKVDISNKLEAILKQSCEGANMKLNLLDKIEYLTLENVKRLEHIRSMTDDVEENSKNIQLLELANKQLKKVVEEKEEVVEKVSQENKDIFEIVDRLSEEKSEILLSLELMMKELEKRAGEKIELAGMVEKLSEENKRLVESLQMSNMELQKVKKERNEILESQTQLMKETEDNILLAHEGSVEVKNDLLKRVELIEKEKQNLKRQLEEDLKKIREAYTHVVSANSKLELENVNLRKKIEEKSLQLAEYSQIKEAYEKLLEENSKLMTEVDTVKYKRSRDREEFVNLLKRERDEADSRETRKIRDVQNEYEGKLEKMKDKMLKLYREEVDREMQKVKAEQSGTSFVYITIDELRHDLSRAKEKIHMLETERDMLRIKEGESKKHVYSSRESLRSFREDSRCNSTRSSVSSVQSLGRDNRLRTKTNSHILERKVKSVSAVQSSKRDSMRPIVERRIPTLPREHAREQVMEVEEMVFVARRTSINGVPANIGQNLQMEDEDDDFNNKYLADLKAGKCEPTGRESSSTNRFSELAWRNSLVPPHLKSSYPAETQFVSPTQFKEDEIKSGTVELDNSLCKLLPNEKPRQKKDFGTTSYKKPGPPTPSKNGGRLSLQGNEVQPLREHNERSPKKTTPSRIKALFMGRSMKENSENQSVTPKGSKRLSIFKKQR